ncbi:hypothetical protein DPV78_011907 [Talaromyces pinophilus]|jgi:hypothetical protein|nr:hypothetical protein DPV78_011907 [Talaromyces pinophilus]
MEIPQQGLNSSLDQMTGGNKIEIRIGQMRGRRKVKYEDGSTVERGQEGKQLHAQEVWNVANSGIEISKQTDSGKNVGDTG